MSPLAAPGPPTHPHCRNILPNRPGATSSFPPEHSAAVTGRGPGRRPGKPPPQREPAAPGVAAGNVLPDSVWGQKERLQEWLPSSGELESLCR